MEKISTKDEIINFYLKNPTFLIRKAKAKNLRFKLSKSFKPYDALYITEFEKYMLNGEYTSETKQKFLKEIYRFAMKNPSYLFQSELFSDKNAIINT